MSRITPFGISALSKSNLADAYPYEIMINKETGEVVICSNRGDALSYNYFSRLKTHMDSLELTSRYNSIYGNMYEVIINNEIELPALVTSTVIANNISISYPVKGFIISADADYINNTANGLSILTYDDLVVSFTIDVYEDGNIITTITETVTVTESRQLYIPVTNTNTNITIRNITLHIPDDASRLTILNSILLFIEN